MYLKDEFVLYWRPNSQTDIQRKTANLLNF